MKTIHVLLALSLFMMFPVIINAQVPSCCDPMNMPVISICGNTFPQGIIRVQGDVKIVEKDKILKDNKEVANPMNKKASMTGFPMKLMYGVTDWVTAQIAIPYMKKDMRAGKMDNSSSGIGDMMLMSKWRLVQSVQGRPAVALNLGVKFPTGDDEVNPSLGTGGYGMIAGGLISKSISKTSLYGNLIYQITFENSATKVNPGDITTINVAATYRAVEMLLLSFEVNSEIVGKDKKDSKVLADNGATVYLTPGMKFNPIRPLIIEACLQIAVRQPDGLAGGYVPYFGLILNF